MGYTYCEEVSYHRKYVGYAHEDYFFEEVKALLRLDQHKVHECLNDHYNKWEEASMRGRNGVNSHADSQGWKNLFYGQNRRGEKWVDSKKLKWSSKRSNGLIDIYYKNDPHGWFFRAHSQQTIKDSNSLEVLINRRHLSSYQTSH